MGFTGYFEFAEALTLCWSSGREMLNLSCRCYGKTLCRVLWNDFRGNVWTQVSLSEFLPNAVLNGSYCVLGERGGNSGFTMATWKSDSSGRVLLTKRLCKRAAHGNIYLENFISSTLSPRLQLGKGTYVLKSSWVYWNSDFGWVVRAELENVKCALPQCSSPMQVAGVTNPSVHSSLRPDAASASFLNHHFRLLLLNSSALHRRGNMFAHHTPCHALYCEFKTGLDVFETQTILGPLY